MFLNFFLPVLSDQVLLCARRVVSPRYDPVQVVPREDKWLCQTFCSFLSENSVKPRPSPPRPMDAMFTDMKSELDWVTAFGCSAACSRTLSIFLFSRRRSAALCCCFFNCRCHSSTRHTSLRRVFADESLPLQGKQLSFLFLAQYEELEISPNMWENVRQETSGEKKGCHRLRYFKSPHSFQALVLLCDLKWHARYYLPDKKFKKNCFPEEHTSYQVTTSTRFCSISSKSNFYYLAFSLSCTSSLPPSSLAHRLSDLSCKTNKVD